MKRKQKEKLASRGTLNTRVKPIQKISFSDVSVNCFSRERKNASTTTINQFRREKKHERSEIRRGGMHEGQIKEIRTERSELGRRGG